jgi:hypothetical protein
MLRAYYEIFISTAPSKNERTYAMYLKKLASLADEEDRATRPDKRVIQMLAQIKDHYRNPIVMADQVVSVDEATQLFGMASALISLMAEAIAAQRRGAGVEGAAASLLAASEGDDDSLYDFRMKEAG